MPTRHIKKPTVKASAVKRFLRKLRRNESGNAAIEFAFIAPGMVLIYFGLVEVSLLVEADRNVTHATSLIGDLVAQGDELTPDMLETYIAASLSILRVGFESTDNNVGIELTSFEAAADGTINEIGYAQYGTAYEGVVTSPGPGEEPVASETESTHFDGSTINSAFAQPGTGVIVARINYDYKSPLQYFVKTITLRETFFLKPRRSAIIEFGDPDAGKTDMNCVFSSATAIDCTAKSGPTS